MIGTRLDGGLGNQLFQYAAGRALALRHGTGLMLDLSALGTNVPGVTSRKLELSNFKLSQSLVKSVQSGLPSWIHRFPAWSRWISPWRVYLEKHLGFNPQFSALPDNSFLIGYWQSFRYLSDVAEHLINDLTPIAPLSPTSMDLARQIDSSASVAIHVRRGDYVSLAAAASFHGTLSEAYYFNAMREMSHAIEGARYFVFSDDPQWCRAHLVLDETAVLVTHNVGADSWQDLMLMSRCRHHIIANSSFSWWGAWLADQRCPKNASRMVIAPARWFAGDPGLNLSDRFPPHWLIR